MDLQLYVLLRPRSGGVYAEVVGIPNVTAFEPDRETALRAIRSELDDQIRWRDRSSWGQLQLHPELELRTLHLDAALPGGEKGKRCQVPVTLLVARQPRGEDSLYLVTAPDFKRLQLLVPDRDRVEPEARRHLTEQLAACKPAKLFRLNQAEPDSLEAITLALPAPSPGEEDEDDDDADLSDSDQEEGEDVLTICGTDLTAQAAGGRLGGADRREELLDRMLTALASGRCGGLLLVGPPDAGKTALVNELARRLSRGEVPEALRDRALWSVTGNNLIAGMKYYGEWQGRAQALVRQVSRGRQIVYMGDPNEILNAGRCEDSDSNLGRYLRPYMESREITLICECSPEAYAAELRREPSFIHAFRKIEVSETGEADTLAILQATALRLEQELPVKIQPAALTSICDLTRRYLPYRAFPGKAVRYLDQLTSDLAAGAGGEGAPRELGRTEAIRGFARSTGLPEFLLSDEVPLPVAEVRAHFEDRLLGQPDAVEAMTGLVTVLKAGLNDPQKPLGSFFFVGPTGVGKTEMAKVLAEYLFGSRDRMLRFDMSEYSSLDAVPRLIGSAWKAEAGELTRKVREQPFCVVLLDEIEKAHPEVFDVLLSVLGEGRLTDAGGRTADFRNAIVVMTSNLGAGQRQLRPLGFAEGTGNPHQLESHFIREAEAFFRPEFFNRIDRIVAFRPLSEEAIRRITRRELGKLLMREGIVRRELLVEIDDTVIDRLAARGFHPLYGARPLKREIERAVILPLAQVLVEQRATSQHLLRFTLRDGEIELILNRIEPEPGAEPPVATLSRSERRLETGLVEIQQTLAGLHARIDDLQHGRRGESLREEVSTLLERTREPSFWDEPVAARDLLRRVYRIERVLRRVDVLLERVERLEEKSGALRRQKDRRELLECSEAVSRLGDDLTYLEIEMAATAVGERNDRALIRILPLGAEAEPWAARLARMYRQWAERKGYECHLLEIPDAENPSRAGNGMADRGPSLYVRGTHVYEFLRSEEGLHRFTENNGEARQRNLARVRVYAVHEPLEDPSPEAVRSVLGGLLSSPAQMASEETALSEVVRTYSTGRHPSVRDPRTDTRTGRPDTVLKDGMIDPFILAYLRAQVEEGKKAEPAVDGAELA